MPYFIKCQIRCIIFYFSFWNIFLIFPLWVLFLIILFTSVHQTMVAAEQDMSRGQVRSRHLLLFKPISSQCSLFVPPENRNTLVSCRGFSKKGVLTWSGLSKQQCFVQTPRLLMNFDWWSHFIFNANLSL